ncbi:hypothetical protein BOTBODRAFT_173779 [Botryobasidium botryosum FD-172 SS1]|uniref:TLC domain-containing protein n=1 Tax=Botryobasidium botryosum (strain FD-172 SS1) TaxID=930990 RepID=A0A067MIV0_BOTB1|nr:hypothetical protein BOTBODRAFT_173779 [Botryobasidium botryosum FD-172 SS1]
MISNLLNFSFVVTGVDLCCIFIVVRVLLEDWLMAKWFKSAAYEDLDFKGRRALTSHVGMLFFKALCLIGIIPMLLMQPDSEKIEDGVSIGDVLAWTYLTIPTVYIFEITYRPTLSIISTFHHLISVAHSAKSLAAILSESQKGFVAKADFQRILIYGTFEMIFEIMLHNSRIMYQRYRQRPAFLVKVFRITAIAVFVGTFIEQFAVVAFYVRIWAHWPLHSKIATPLLHACLTVAQIHSGRVCWKVAQRLMEEAKDQKREEELRIAEAGGDNQLDKWVSRISTVYAKDDAPKYAKDDLDYPASVYANDRYSVAYPTERAGSSLSADAEKRAPPG